MTSTTTKPSRTSLQRLRLVIWALVGIAALGFGALLLSRSGEPSPSTAPGMTFTMGGPFTLVGANGKPFSSTQLAGKPYAMFFGFTNCPDVCPNTLARLAQLRQQLGQGEDSFRIVFVSVDPERDTPEAMRTYQDMLGTPVIALTGSPAQIARVTKSHAIHFAKVPQEGAPDGYTMDHTAAVLLFDKAGKFQSTIALEEQDPAALSKLQRLTA